MAVRVHVGLGKSYAARHGIAELLASDRFGARKVIYAVPTYDLADEQCQAFSALGIDTMVWKGRTARDPAPDDPDRHMCLNPSAVQDAIAAGLPVETSACRATERGIVRKCAFYAFCGFQAQKRRIADAQVILVAHASLFHRPPAEVVNVGLLVLDESFTFAGLRGVTERVTLIFQRAHRDLTKKISPDGGDPRASDHGGALHTVRDKLWDVLQAASPGPLSVAELSQAGLTPAMCRLVASVESRRTSNLRLLPDMDSDERQRRIEMAQQMPGARRSSSRPTAVMWRLIAQALEGGHDVGGVVVDGPPLRQTGGRSICLHWREDIRAGWGTDGPILHMDATLQPELVRPYIPEIIFTEPVMAREANVIVWEILGAPTTGQKLIPLPGATLRAHTTAETHLQQLTTFIACRAAEFRARDPQNCDVLVIGQEAVINIFRRRKLPTNIKFGHFNALRGRDRWRDVACIIVIGRTMPPAADIELHATALTNRVTEANRPDGEWWYPKVERRIALTTGGTYTVRGEQHDNPVAEAVRWSICEAELVQAIGRGRGVNRTSTNPLQIDILTDVVLPIPVNHILQWGEVQPTRDDIMVAAGVVLENTSDKAQAFPDLWSSREAAKKDAQRKGTSCSSRYFSNSSLSPSSAVASYRRSGAGQKNRTASFDLMLIPDPKSWLQKKIGPLAHFEMLSTDMVDAVGKNSAAGADARTRLKIIGRKADTAILLLLERMRNKMACVVSRLEHVNPTTSLKWSRPRRPK